MSDYARQHDFSTKTGTTIFSSEVDEEFDALVTAVASKVDESREGDASGIATLDGSALLPAGISGTPTNAGGQLPEASATALGGVELATQAEAEALTDPLRAITAGTLGDVVTQLAGNGLALASGVLSVDASEISSVTPALSDAIVFEDASDNTTKKATITAINGTMSLANLSDYNSTQHVSHSGVSITAGNGLTGGGTIAATRTIDITDVAATTTNPIDISSGAFDIDLTALTTYAANDIQPDDLFYFDNGGTPAAIKIQEMGMRVQTGGGTQTLASNDMNSIMEFVATATLTLPLNATTALPVGVPIVLNMKHATQELTVTADTGVTLVSTFHPAGGSAASDTVKAGGTALLYKTAANVWCISGDIST